MIVLGSAVAVGACVEIHDPSVPAVEQSGLTTNEIPTYHEVQPILMERCAPCHVGEQLYDCPSTCFASFYESLPGKYTCCAPPFTLYDEPPDDCTNLSMTMTIGECGLDRVINFVADGKDAVPPDQVLILKTWIEHGMPE